jgi:hypothetical protein
VSSRRVSRAGIYTVCGKQPAEGQGKARGQKGKKVWWSGGEGRLSKIEPSGHFGPGGQYRTSLKPRSSLRIRRSRLSLPPLSLDIFLFRTPFSHPPTFNETKSEFLRYFLCAPLYSPRRLYIYIYISRPLALSLVQ